jgi:hypothetical protein
LGTSGDKLSLSLKLGRELLPETAVFAWLSTLCARLRLVKLLPWERSFFWSVVRVLFLPNQPTKKKNKKRTTRKTV